MRGQPEVIARVTSYRWHPLPCAQFSNVVEDANYDKLLTGSEWNKFAFRIPE